MHFEKLSFKHLWVFCVIWLRLPSPVQCVIHWYSILPLLNDEKSTNFREYLLWSVNFCLYFTVTCWADEIMVGHESTCTDPWPIDPLPALLRVMKLWMRLYDEAQSIYVNGGSLIGNNVIYNNSDVGRQQVYRGRLTTRGRWICRTRKWRTWAHQRLQITTLCKIWMSPPVLAL